MIDARADADRNEAPVREIDSCEGTDALSFVPLDPMNSIASYEARSASCWEVVFHTEILP